MRPGIEPTKVRRWPRISASSRTPPSDMRTNLRLVALAIDWPSEVLPMPGGPTRHRIAPFICFTRVCTARYSRMRSLTFSSRSEEHTSELQSLMRISYADFCLKKKTQTQGQTTRVNGESTTRNASEKVACELHAKLHNASNALQ